MKVKDLIKKLSKLSPESEIINVGFWNDYRDGTIPFVSDKLRLVRVAEKKTDLAGYLK